MPNISAYQSLTQTNTLYHVRYAETNPLLPFVNINAGDTLGILFFLHAYAVSPLAQRFVPWAPDIEVWKVTTTLDSNENIDRHPYVRYNLGQNSDLCIPGWWGVVLPKSFCLRCPGGPDTSNVSNAVGYTRTLYNMDLSHLGATWYSFSGNNQNVQSNAVGAPLLNY